MRRSLIVDVTSRLVILSAVVLGIYLLTAGHNQPGGGFIGGLVTAAAIVLAYVAGGLDQVRSLLPVRPWSVLGGGLAVTTASAIVPLLLGGSVLEQDYVTFHPPVIGDIKLTSALAFDTGVFAVVVGLVLMAFEGLGEDLRPGEADDEEDATP